MMVMLRFDPFFRDLDRLAQQLWGNTVGTATRPAVMPMDAWREGDKVVVEFDLPGIAVDSLDITVDHDVVTVRAERPASGDGARDWVVAECPHGVFSRQLFLGDHLDTDNVVADYTDGVLRLTIPLAEQAKPRKIAIQAGAQQALHA
ncbi:Hsp20/alpha crystallin family protein [Mycobacterium sp.]|uniref:Hsp20/alpha crystallin family protein n=1 Tax=Mycobacterium sp. TaxID=1785 RepID=UPI00128048C1|nr:Hsp20/alpha crystallin family protein [Mycobacterium sp.]KAA8962863.1 MAG: Hsp20/alpha crystallin family protein [Mycobacterium sp.]